MLRFFDSPRWCSAPSSRRPRRNAGRCAAGRLRRRRRWQSAGGLDGEFSGMAAVGCSIAGGTLELRCASGTRTASTAPTGATASSSRRARCRA
ncbi:MAG: hypothetical protein U1F25_16815 [Rubrivivax sp.]